MKKLIWGLAAMAALTMLAAPAIAATQWNFGASLRYATFWTEQDAGKVGMADLQGGGAGLDQDGLLDWSAQGNSNIQMHMQSDNLEGYIELEWDFDGNKVTTSQYWGKYRFGNGAYIAIGQQEQLFSQFISNQVWGGDLNMNGIGTAYAKATPKIVLGYGGFALALSQPYTKRLNSYDDWTRINISSTSSLNSDIDTYLPQLQASYEYAADTWRVKLAGAYQYTKLSKARESYVMKGVDDIHSWLVGLDGDVNFGPLYLAAAVSVGQNWSDAGWNDETGGISDTWTGNYFSNNFGKQLVWLRDSATNSYWDSEDTTSLMLSTVAAYRLTEALRFEVGAGYRYDRSDAFNKNSNIWNVYLQASYTVAPGFTILPEIGYIDFGKTVGRKHYYARSPQPSNDAGSLWYAGAQWRMDF